MLFSLSLINERWKNVRSKYIIKSINNTKNPSIVKIKFVIFFDKKKHLNQKNFECCELLTYCLKKERSKYKYKWNEYNEINNKMYMKNFITETSLEK